MSLFPNSGGGSFLPLLSWKGKDKQWMFSKTVRDDVGRKEKQMNRFAPAQFKAQFLVNTCKVGWGLIGEGAPVMVMEKLTNLMQGKPPKEKPADRGTESFKESCEIEVLLIGKSTQVPCRLSGIGPIIYNALSTILAEVVESPEYKAGKEPIIIHTDCTIFKHKRGDTFVPVFAIEGWADPVSPAHTPPTEGSADDEDMETIVVEDASQDGLPF